MFVHDVKMNLLKFICVLMKGNSLGPLNIVHCLIMLEQQYMSLDAFNIVIYIWIPSKKQYKQKAHKDMFSSCSMLQNVFVCVCQDFVEQFFYAAKCLCMLRICCEPVLTLQM